MVCMGDEHMDSLQASVFLASDYVFLIFLFSLSEIYFLFATDPQKNSFSIVFILIYFNLKSLKMCLCTNVLFRL